MKKRFVILIIVLFVIILSAGGYGYSVYKDIFKSNVSENTFLYMPTHSDFNAVTDSLVSSGVIEDIASFKQTALLKKYGEKIYPGRYQLEKGMSNNALVNMLRSGKQNPVKLTFNNIRTINELASKVATSLETDSISIVELLNNEKFIENLGFDQRNIIGMFIPNTYELYWNTNAEEFIEKMHEEYEKFWSDERKEKAKKLKLSPQEVSVLASIVQAEQRAFNDEKPIVAGLYINRIQRNMALESDPTLIFASGDFTKKRVLNKDKEIEIFVLSYNDEHQDIKPEVWISSFDSTEKITLTLDRK